MKCPDCGFAPMERQEVDLFRTKFEGVWIEVPNAWFQVCPKCEIVTYHASELKRWKKIKDAQHS